jgi:hypothetical protein
VLEDALLGFAKLFAGPAPADTAKLSQDQIKKGAAG